MKLSKIHSLNSFIRSKISSSQNNWEALKVALALSVIAKLAVVFVAGLAYLMIPENVDAGGFQMMPQAPFSNALVRWDVGWYFSIVNQGYTYSPDSESSVAFFPLFPFLIYILKGSLGIGIVTASNIVSFCGFFGALFSIYKLVVMKLGDEDLAAKTCFILVLFPSAFYFQLPYTESLFLGLTCGSFLAAESKKWIWAGILASLASATRVTGIFVGGALFLVWCAQTDFLQRPMRRLSDWWLLTYTLIKDYRVVFCLIIAPTGLLAYMVFLWVEFGDPLAFANVQKHWGRSARGIVSILYNGFLEIRSINWEEPISVQRIVHIFDYSAIILGLISIIPIWRKLGPAYACWTLAGVIIPATTSSASMLRYIAVLFPIFVILANWGKHRFVIAAYTICFLLLQALFLSLYTNWSFVG